MCNLRPDEGNFRLAPSVGIFRFGPAPRVFDEIKDTAGSMIADSDDRFAIKHQFFGHGRRDRQWGYIECENVACADRQLTDDLGHEAITAADHLNGSPAGNAIVHPDRIWNEVEDGSCVVVNLSEPDDPDALQQTIGRTRLQVEDFSEDSPRTRLAPDGQSFAIGDASGVWTAGFDMGTVESHSFLRFRSNESMALDKTMVLGSKGVSSAGERHADMMLNSPRSSRARFALPTSKLPANLQTGKNT